MLIQLTRVIVMLNSQMDGRISWKFENRRIKIPQVNWIHVKIHQVTLIFYGVARGSLWRWHFLNSPPVRSPLIEKSMLYVI